MNKSFIDIDEIFKSKNPGLYRLLPGFILKWLKKIVHQEEINGFIDRHGHKNDLLFVEAIIKEFGVNLEFSGAEHVPKTGGFVVAANHPVGGLDAMALVNVIGSRRDDLSFIVNDILLKIKNLQGIFTGVNKHGRNSLETAQSLDQIYASGKGILIFPAGLVSRKRKGVIRDLAWKKSFITKSKKHHLPVLPVHIEGKNSDFFYGLSRFRTLLGIKANIEMLFLADEMYKQKGKTIRITFGRVIPHTMFDKSQSDQKWADQIKEHVYALPANQK